MICHIGNQHRWQAHDVTLPVNSIFEGRWRLDVLVSLNCSVSV